MEEIKLTLEANMIEHLKGQAEYESTQIGEEVSVEDMLRRLIERYYPIGDVYVCIDYCLLSVKSGIQTVREFKNQLGIREDIELIENTEDDGRLWQNDEVMNIRGVERFL